jgi:predicted transcriptional regulator
MSKTKFSYWLDDKTKARLKVVSEFRKETIGYLTNKALEDSLKIWEEKMKNYYKDSLTPNL